MGRGNIKIPSEIFCLTVSKNAVGEPFSLSSISGIEKVWMREWGGGSIKVFRRKIFVSHSRKTLQGNLSVLRFGNFPVSHRFMDEKRGSIKFFRRIFFVAQCRKMP